MTDASEFLRPLAGTAYGIREQHLTYTRHVCGIHMLQSVSGFVFLTSPRPVP